MNHYIYILSEIDKGNSGHEQQETRGEYWLLIGTPGHGEQYRIGRNTLGIGNTMSDCQLGYYSARRPGVR